jgi:hypothetical protein
VSTITRSTPGHSLPSAAVIGLDIRGVTHVVPDIGEIEHTGIAVERELEVGSLDIVTRWEQPGLGYGKPEAKHGGVRGVFLHRLQGEWAVEYVHVIHQHCLLEPFAGGVIPRSEAVDHQVVVSGLAQVEWLDRDPFHLELDPISP